MNKNLFKLPDKVDDINELKRRIKETLDIIYKECFDSTKKYCDNCLDILKVEEIVYMLERGKDI